jgi:SsrA-binding protein
MAARKGNRKGEKAGEPTIVNRRARHDYVIEATLECGIKLVGTEVKSVRNGQVSLAEGYVRAVESPPRLELHGVHIGEYPPAGEHRQHAPVRTRVLLAHRREIRKLADQTREKGVTIVPLKMYFVNGRAKLLVGVGRGKRRADKRQDLSKQEARREIDRAMSRRR